MNFRGCTFVLLVSALSLKAQWVHRYPQVTGLAHQIYLEGYELPTVAHGCLDPAPTPDGKQLYFTGMGWIWRLELQTGKATRITQGPACDSRPAVSMDGNRLVFLRDDTHTIWIVLKDLMTGEERELVRSGKLDLDPVFTADGREVIYASSESGDLNLWRVDLASGQRRRLCTEGRQELRPQPSPDARHLLYLHKSRDIGDQVRWLDLKTGRQEVLHTGAILSLTRPALSPDGQRIALAMPLPGTDVYRLYATDLTLGGRNLLPVCDSDQPLTPAWSPDGQWIYFSEDDGTHAFILKRAPLMGGRAEAVPIRQWDWGVPTATLTLRTLQGQQPMPARMEVTDGKGHPLFPPGTPIRFDPQNGRTYFHGQGEVSWTVPAGTLMVTACRGFSNFPVSQKVMARAGEHARVDLTVKPFVTPRSKGWYSGDLHLHLNYGGVYRLRPEDLITVMDGEDLDVAQPMVANLESRLSDLAWLSWRSNRVSFTQEVRCNFQGHIGLYQAPRLFWPWAWGPGAGVLDTIDVLNADVLRFARKNGALSSYVHPIPVRDPFTPENLKRIPPGFVPDAVVGLLDAVELSGLWSHELGSSELYYRLLNIGIPMLPTAGTDAFPNFSRCATVGSNRTFVQVDGPCTLEAYFAGLRQGRAFVSSGPIVDFRVDGNPPGGVIASRNVAWSLDLATPLPLEHLEILVNGNVVSALKPMSVGGSARFKGTLTLPQGGWIAFRAWDERSGWPTMSLRVFAHTAPHWIRRKGSTEPATARASARDLLKALRVSRAEAERRLAPGPMKRLFAQCDAAEAKLEALCR